MVLDGCFLLVLFLTNAGKIPKENAIFSMPWALPSIRRDLLLLGNQIPLVVLQTLLDTAIFLQPSDLQEIALKFFNGCFKVGEQSLVKKHPKFEAKHLLDLIRQTLILIQPHAEGDKNAAILIQPPQTTSVTTPAEGDNNAAILSQPPQTTSGTIPAEGDNNAAILNQPPQTTSVTIPAEGDNNASIARQTRLTLPVNKLRSRGVKFEVKKGARTLLDISFKNGVLQIPEIILDDFISVFLLNCIAFEQFHANSTTEITSYAMFMGCLINSERDAAYLAEKGIIQNYLGTDQDDVSRFFKRILNDYVFDDENSYLADVIKDVDEYSSNGCNVRWASFKQTYVGSLWIALSKLAALAILLLTIAQVVLAAIALKSGNKQG
ncbi:PREDICTED: UPF0481 protein At3g47200-like [Camelina sativa]|uniref:UPF0481 protein At3g47200-like n=1 Tax=Camelina sativa TaxID=90675 RepID=A0ABM0WKQ1_CAMSA|nr:PREDICTED: UPF0481 protein At3g47200-like [Camelina sativa]